MPSMSEGEKPETTTGTVTASQPEPEQSKQSAPEFTDEVDKWKHFSRVNEERATENYRKLQDAEKRAAETDERLSKTVGELNDSRMENAKLKAMLKHPQLTEDVFAALFKGDNPEDVEAWAEQAAKLIPMPEPAEPAEPATAEPDDGDTPTHGHLTKDAKHIIDGDKGKGTYKAGPVKGEAYKRSMDRQRERAAHFHKKKNND